MFRIRVSLPHPFHSDPDPGLEIFADPDPELVFPPKISVLYESKVKNEHWICIKMQFRIQIQGLQKMRIWIQIQGL